MESEQEHWAIPEAGQELAAQTQTDSVRTSSAQRFVKQVSLADQGRVLHQTKGCVACHSVDGTTKARTFA